MDAVTAHRIHFAFTATYHYLSPQLTMGLALIIVILKSAALRTADAHYDRAAGFWGRILAINFAMGVVTGIPLEFQFGTNWSRFSRGAGGVIGQTLPWKASSPSSSNRPSWASSLYVLEGSIITQVKGASPQTVHAGGVFYESPTDVHSVSRNASETQPAKLLVFYVKAKGAPPTVLLREGER